MCRDACGNNLCCGKRRVPDWEDCGTYSDELRKELEYYEIQTEPRKPIRRLNYQCFMFDAVLHGKLGREWHWAVWDAERGKLLDPYKPEASFAAPLS